jgi:hypothetical protein
MQKPLWEDLPTQIKKVEVNTVDRINVQTKVCSKCNTEQPIENFDPQYFRKDGSKSHRGNCRSCCLFNQRIVNKLKEIHGPPPDLCECCGRPPNGVTGLVTDHCHTTYKFRGWLCTSCNLANGHLKDSPETIMKLYKYMTKEK